MQSVVTPVYSRSTSQDVDSIVLKMLTELATAKEKPVDHQDREYQAFLVELAKKKNIIVCLPTGSGKTFIALLLAKHYLKTAIETNRKIIFLANTVPLVNQQAEYFRKHLSNQFLNEDSHHVECLTGDRQVDYWERKKWEVVLKNCNVIVMTTQIFVDALGHNYMEFKDVIFLILDECHHTDKDAPMNKVMEMYRDILASNDMKLDLQKLPRILGLTATIINGKGKKIEVAREVKDAEERLCARAVTYYKYEEVLKYSTCAKVDYVLFNPEESKAWSQDLANPLRNFLTLVMSSKKELFTEKLPDIYHPSFKTNEQRFNSKESDLKVLKSLVKEVLDVFKDLGPYCAKIAAIHKRAYIQTKNIDDVDNIYTGYMIKALDTALTMFICQIERIIGRHDEASQVQIFVTDKVTKLTEILKKYDSGRTNAQKDDDLSGLIFVQQRITAQALTWYLEDAARTPAYAFIKPGFVVGSSTFGLDPVEARITANEQASVIRKFRSRDYNILVATRVLEEGLDVPACNLVIRFDKVHTYPSYVQSMGRARNKTSKFFGFIDASDENAQKEQYDYFEKYNMQLSEYLKQNAIHADDDLEDDVRTTAVDKIIPNFEPNPGRSPRITALESISIAQRYCQTLPCDKLVTLSPVSWWQKVEPSGYKAYVQFPSNAVIREIVPGKIQETKMLAKRSAFLEACILLYKRNVLDEQLFPLPRRLNPVLNAYLETISIEKDPQGRKVGSNKRTQQYNKKIPSCFELGKIYPGCQCRVYEIHIEQLKPTEDRIASSLYRFSERNNVYCIITPVDLSMIPQFILNVNPSIGNLVVTLKEIQLQDRPVGVRLSLSEINKLQSVQRYIFGDLLKLKREIMKPTDESSFLIAPLKRDGGHTQPHSIHWDLITKLEKFTEDFFSTPSDETRKNFVFKVENYEDAVVVPWYRGKERFFYTIIEVCKDESPLSPFHCNKSYPNYMAYYIQKYPAVKYIVDQNQRLLKAKLISSNLNFFKTNISYKKSQEERKDQRDSVIELIPELTNIHPLPASLYIQSKLLTSVIQRIHRFLLALEIQKFVAKETPWNDLSDVGKDYMEEYRNLIFKTDPIDAESSPAKKSKCSLEHVEREKVNGTTVQVRQPLQFNFNLENQLADLSILEDRVEPKRTVSRESQEPVLDFIHPRNLSLAQVDRIKDRSKGLREVRIRKSGDIKIDENDTSFDWKHDKETAVELIKFDQVDQFIKERLDGEFTFSPEKQPTLYTLMQSITMEASLDSVTLERLETIGDSFLKYCVSRHIYSYFPDEDEGKMTQWRSTLVSNKHLYSIGKSLNLGGYLAAGIFRPECAWLPPSFCIPKLLSEVAAKSDLNEDVYGERNLSELEKLSFEELLGFVESNKFKAPNLMPGNVGYTHARIPDKSIADSVEALIGAYFISGGQGGALHFMKKLGFLGPTSTENVLVPFGKWPCPTPQYEAGNDSVSNHHSLFGELEKVLCYHFKEPWLLVEAFSHPCYMKNRVTGCYQRLEFLGDAVLDFLITNHIYKSGIMSPGDLTDLRSALVNNVTFGSLSVRYGFETYLLNTDRRLQEAIDVFVECQKEAKHQVTGHFKLISDLECHLVSDIDCPKVLGDIFESLAGAVFIDSGMSLDTVWKVFYRLMKNEIDTFSLDVPKSPVRELYENNPGRELFRDITDEAFKTGAAKEPGMTYVSLTVPIADERGELQPIIGMGKSKQNAKIAAAKYANKLRKFQAKI